MSFKHGKDAEIWLGGADVSGYFRSMEFSSEADTAETTTFKKSWKTHIAGLPSATVSLEGVYDPEFNEPMPDALGAVAGSILTIGPAGMESVGDLCRLVKARTTQYAESSPIGDAVLFDLAVLADGATATGDVLKPLGEVTEDANGSTHTGPVGGTSNGAIAHLHALAVSASDTVDVKLQHSTNGTDWTDITGGAFTQVSAAGAERIEIAGTINRYTRAVWDVTGTSVSINFGVAIARL